MTTCTCIYLHDNVHAHSKVFYCHWFDGVLFLMNSVCHHVALHVDTEHVPVHCTRTYMRAVLRSGEWNFLGFRGYLECCFTFLFSVSLLKLFGFSFLL